MKYEMIQQPSWESVKEELEGRFKIELYGRTINGTHILTQWSPIYIDIRWSEISERKTQGFWLTIAPSESKKSVYCTPTWEHESLEQIISRLSGYCQRQEAEQMRLF